MGFIDNIIECLGTKEFTRLKIGISNNKNIDTKDGTNCLRILYGDWNDALDGLGKTNEPDKIYGTGVSVMASLHFYQNLYEISDITRQLSISI